MKDELLDDAKENNGYDLPSKDKQMDIWNRMENYFKNTDAIVDALFRPALLVYLIALVIISYVNQSDYLPTLFLAFPTLVLAVVTMEYVLLTRNLVKINQEMVNAQSQPKFSLNYDFVKSIDNNIPHVSIALYLRNSGDVARNLRITFKPNWQFQKAPITILSIVRDERFIILEDLNIIQEAGRILTIDLEYETMFSKKYHDVLVLSNEQLQNLGGHPHTIETIRDIEIRDLFRQLVPK